MGGVVAGKGEYGEPGGCGEGAEQSVLPPGDWDDGGAAGEARRQPAWSVCLQTHVPDEISLGSVYSVKMRTVGHRIPVLCLVEFVNYV